MFLALKMSDLHNMGFICNVYVYLYVYVYVYVYVLCLSIYYLGLLKM